MVRTECAHCKTPMELTIDSDLNYTVEPIQHPDMSGLDNATSRSSPAPRRDCDRGVNEKGCEPMVFMPDVDLLNLQEEGIINAF